MHNVQEIVQKIFYDANQVNLYSYDETNVCGLY